VYESATDQDGDRAAHHVPALEGRVAALRAEGARLDPPAPLGIDERHVGRRAGRQRARRDAEDAGRPGRRMSIAGFAGICAVAPALPLDASIVRHPTAYEDVRPAVREFERRNAPGEPIYVFAASVPAWAFYTTDWSAPDTSRLARMARLASSGGPAFENAAPRGRAIRIGEGDSLAFPFRRGREIIGLYHGAQDRHATGLVQQVPDTNWTTNEARRIRNAATPTVWLLMSHTYGLERSLRGALELCVDRMFQRDGVVLARFTSAPRSSECSQDAALAPRGQR